MARNYYKGLYKVQNLDKYLGDPNKCIYRSSWEKTLLIKLDHSSNILKFGIEPFSIKYINKYDNDLHNYWPDFIVIMKGKDGTPKTLIIEVKPHKETLPPKKRGKRKDVYLKECKTYITNMSKWDAAEKFCKDKGWHFLKLTEKELFSRI